jgi:hypothetical protein
MPTMAAAPLPSPALGAAAQAYESGTAGSSRHGGGAKEPATAPVGVPASQTQHPWISSSSSYATGHVLLSQAGNPLRRKALRRTSGRTRLPGAPSPGAPPCPSAPPPPGASPTPGRVSSFLRRFRFPALSQLTRCNWPDCALIHNLQHIHKTLALRPELQTHHTQEIRRGPTGTHPL